MMREKDIRWMKQRYTNAEINLMGTLLAWAVFFFGFAALGIWMLLR